MADGSSAMVGDEDRKDYRGLICGILVFVAALSMRLSYLAGIETSPYYNIDYLKGTSDCYRFFQAALIISSGDVIGEGVFVQAPLYPYLLGLLFKILGGGNFLIPRFIQIIMGSGTAVLAYCIARRLKNDGAGILAGLFAAFYGPLILYDAAILRTGLLAFLYALLILLMISGQARPGLLRGILCGAVFGLGILGKANIMVMLPVTPWWIYEAGKRSGPKSAVRLLIGTLAGLALIMSPLVIRNTAAHVPPFALTEKGPLEFIAGNHLEGGANMWQPTSDMLKMSAESQGSMLKALGIVLRSHRDKPLDLAKKQLVKTRAFLNGYEAPGNINYYVEKRYVGFLNKPWINWPVLLGFAVIGIWALRKKGREGAMLYSYVFLYSIGVIAFYVLARFRIPLVPALCVFAGAGAWMMIDLIRERKWSHFSAAVVIVLAVIIAAWPRVDDPVQPTDYRNLALFHMMKQEPERARELVKQGRDRAGKLITERGDAWSRYRIARIMYLAGDPLEDVAAELKRARQGDPPPWVLAFIDLLEEDCRARLEFGDYKPGGMRF
jgi:4-amino-4-deoxy-L-arabinose transferase-like glycosyltransferase